jgi:hypothetical protein
MSLETTITLQEIHIAVKQGKKRKAPGCDGICHDFFLHTWDVIKDNLHTIMNQMFLDEVILPSQTHGIIVCEPKANRPTHPDDYRPLTLMNADLKLLSLILANRLRPWLNDLLHPRQHCGIQGNNILGAVAAIRETVAQAELTNAPVCIISLDFKAAFDNVAHSYLFATLQAYGFSACF